MEKIIVRLVKNKNELEKAFEVRDTVFGGEQKIASNLNFDGSDYQAKHVIAICRRTIVGTARLLFERNKARLGRLSVIKKLRNKGIASKIMNYIINYCKRKNISEIYFHSQYPVKVFYEKIGFKTRGKPFIEAKIKHIEMYMKIK